MSKLHDLAVRRGYAIGWRVAGALPAPMVAAVIAQASAGVLRHDGVHVRTLRTNLSAATGRPVTDDLVRAAVASYLRNLYEVLALPSWSPRRVVATVTTDGELALRATIAATGAVVGLLADRDLVRRGLPVRWRGHSITMPAGPALVARRSGAALVPAVSQYTPGGMKIIFGEPIQQRPGRDGLVAMTQEVANFFAERIAERPQDWHVMQPFFQRTDITS